MYSPVVKAIADHYGITIADRVCGGGNILKPCYDGTTIASQWCEFSRNYDQGGRCSFTQRIVDLTDHDLLHEIAHWVVGEPEQRTIPDFGMGPVVFGTSDIFTQQVEIGYHERLQQEMTCWLVGEHWGRRHNLPATLSFEPSYAPSWDEFQQKKAEQGKQFGEWWVRAHKKFNELLQSGNVVAL